MALKYRGCQLGEDRAASGVWTGGIWGWIGAGCWCFHVVLPRFIASTHQLPGAHSTSLVVLGGGI